MRQYLTKISRCPLFAHISSEDILRALDLLSAKIIRAEKDAIILHQGMPAKVFGLVLEGCAQVIASDSGGNHTLVTTLHESDLFAEAFAFSGILALPVSVVAAPECTALLLDHSRMHMHRQSEFPAHPILIANLLRIISSKNLQLNQKITVLSQRSTRDKLMAYLRLQQQRSGSSRFTIPLDRQELADYLCVERSAMSSEIGKMKKAGLIACRKNEFEILSAPQEEDVPPHNA